MATVQMDPTTVLASCDKAKEEIAKLRAAHIDSMIDRMMLERRWFGLGRPVYATREEAITEAKKPNAWDISDYTMATWYGQETEHKILKLRKAALFAQRDHKLINLTTGDFALLGPSI